MPLIAETNTKDDNVDDNTAILTIPKKNIPEEILNDQEIVDLIRHLDNYINTEEPDDSVEIHQFTHQEALDALDTVY
ncbi:hypothetical protein F8M41_004935 [Gigaspora margarita]|uniref:Uncharacterized protein n=1 Tax=Gigaspora margarita TaxID=4874 RepID=A0A8H4A6J0_GIGMA|nr:hypothetical protein F8M41_004935 [Gigaspora margarita]